MNRYDLLVADFPDSITKNPRILVSRNSPVALVYGAGGFIGSWLVEALLKKGIQVIGIDDFSLGFRDNLGTADKNKRFHLLAQSVLTPLKLDLPRLDYAFYCVDNLPGYSQPVLKNGLINFLEFCQPFSPKIGLVSTLDLYENHIPAPLEDLRSAEIHLAKFARQHNLNARIIRLSGVYGPRMHFRGDDPVMRLIKASLIGELAKEQPVSTFLTRSLYIEDAITLILKAVFAGATAQKIYDGARLQPVQVVEIKQILLDPIWFEEKGFQITPLPVWSSPNLRKTVKELSWKPRTPLIEGLKQTITYFKNDAVDLKARLDDRQPKLFAHAPKMAKPIESDTSLAQPKGIKPVKKSGQWGSWLILICLALIGYGLIWPIINFGLSGLIIKHQVSQAEQMLASSNWTQAQVELASAQTEAQNLSLTLNSVSFLKRIPILVNFLNQAGRGTQAISIGLAGAEHVINATSLIDQASLAVSGAGPNTTDLGQLYSQANIELTAASQELNQANLTLQDTNLKSALPELFLDQIAPLNDRLQNWAQLVDKSTSLVKLMPKFSGLSGQKNYLVLIANNLNLRPGGGVIENYGLLGFKNGQLQPFKIDQVKALDDKLPGPILPPTELKADLNLTNWSLKDSLSEPDFKTSAQSVISIYQKETSQIIDGVVMLDLTGLANLLRATGDESSANNLLSQVVSSPDPAPLLTLENNFFNSLLFLNKHNWPGLMAGLGQDFAEKHLTIYSQDQEVESYLAAANWTNTFPNIRANQDFLAFEEANVGNNLANYYLRRGFDLSTSLNLSGQVEHTLRISYQNGSPSDVFPGGTYKARFHIYLPLGTKLMRANLGEGDILPTLTSFSDYDRTGYSGLISVAPKESLNLILSYQLAKPLVFGTNGQATYDLAILKQAGSFDDNLTVNFEGQALNFSGPFNEDKEFNVTIHK